ncbi:MAG TPA: DUF3784 domain-containing protein [Candidatus Avamphibacillus sp.]|nr:DUF3784 domain-containing protein [Candidatus Avamphibacillus sp.]
MDKGKIIYIFVMGWSLLIYGGLTYLIAKKKDYTLISGFNNRSKEEQEYLHESGYLEATGKLLTITFWMFFATFVLGLLPIPFGFGIGIAIFLITLLGGMVWVQRYEVPHKRKKMTWITGSISVGTLLFIITITAVGYMDNDINVSEDMFEITGMYGIEWNTEDIEIVELLDKLPEVHLKTNGFATGNLLKGRFRLEDPYGSGLLFIHKNSDSKVLFVATNDEYVMINKKNANETEEIYEQLITVVK